MEINNVSDKEYIYKFEDEEKVKDEKAKKNDEIDKDAFLKLLMTQLSNQDPLNPMEDTEFIGQMAQFTTIEQIQNLNANLQKSQEDIKGSIKALNNNYVDGSIETLKQLIKMEKAMDAYFGETDKSDKIEA